VRVVKSRGMRWAGHVARMGEDRGVYRMLVGRSKGKRPLGRPRRRWEDNIKMDLQEIGGDCGGTCGYGEELSSSINAGTFLTSCKDLLVSFSRRTLLHGVSK
jgi:hypothetical protein